MNIAVDAMGGDHTPGAIVQGALWAYSEVRGNVDTKPKQLFAGLWVIFLPDHSLISIIQRLGFRILGKKL